MDQCTHEVRRQHWKTQEYQLSGELFQLGLCAGYQRYLSYPDDHQTV